MTQSNNSSNDGSLAVGTLLAGRYEIRRRIESAMGSVYLAARPDQLVTIKEIDEMVTEKGASQEDIATFEREVKRLAALKHPVIPQVYDYFIDMTSGRYYLVMQYIGSHDFIGSLDELSGKVDELIVTKWAVELCDGLSYLHSQNPPIINVNLMPSNLMLASRSRVFLLGLASALIAQSGANHLTPAYAAPEVSSGMVEPASDIYSLGVTIYTLLTGEHPSGDSTETLEFFSKNPKPRQLRPHITVEMEALICRAVEYKPEDRWPTADAFGHELRNHLRHSLRGVEIGYPWPITSVFEPDETFQPILTKSIGRPRSSTISAPATTGSLDTTGSLLSEPQTASPSPRKSSRFVSFLHRMFERINKGLEQRKSQYVEQVPETIRCHTDVSFPARVRVGSPHTLRLQIVPATVVLETGEIAHVPKPHAHDVTMSLLVPDTDSADKSSPPVKVTVSVMAENFEIEGETHATIIVPVRGKASAVSFRLVGLEVGPGRIMLDFAQDGRPVGSVDLCPEVVASSQSENHQSALTEGNVDIRSHPGPAPDILIKVFHFRHSNSPGRLHFILSSTKANLRDLPVMDGDLGAVDLCADVMRWVEDHLGKLGEIATKRDRSPDDVAQTLSDIGNKLYDQLLPQQLKNLSWTFRERGVRSVLVLSDEPHIPWELIKPYQANAATGQFEKEDGFWGESFAITHWLRGKPPVQRLSFKRVLAVAAGGPAPRDTQNEMVRDFVPGSVHGSLDASTPVHQQTRLKAIGDELRIIRDLEAGGSRVVILPSLAGSLRDAFGRGDFDLLHVASHAAFGGVASADSSVVLMDDGYFSALELSPRMASAISRDAPLIFFNACETGRIGFSLTRPGSWGAQLVELGCGGFVGSLWTVTDDAALAFARAFYNSMSSGMTISEAMLKAKATVRELFPNDPTWIAYSCFADPMAKL